MDLQVVITREGKLSVFARAGAFGEAKEKIERLLSDLGLEGIELELVGDVERHTHDRPEIHQHESSRQRH